MSVQVFNPPGIVEPQGYAHVAVAAGSRTVYLAGQVGQDEHGTPADGLAAQTAQALTNVSIALGAAGATFAEVVKTTIYVVDWRPEKLAELFEGWGRVAGELGIDPRPTTVIGVVALTAPDLLVEFDVTAVLP
jgi:enamine deaminase RidA (YjgF/YER057c/UK114 family)